LRHLHRSIRDAVDTDVRTARPQNNCFARIINDDVARVLPLGVDHEHAVLEIFVVNRSIIKQSDVGARGF
jgi:hypothetical protein